MSKYPRASLYEEMKQRDLLNNMVQSNERKKDVQKMKAKQLADIMRSARDAGAKGETKASLPIKKRPEASPEDIESKPKP